MIAVSVDDLDAACKRFEDLGVNWKKRLTDGRMKNVAFVLDPDNYCKLHRFWTAHLELNDRVEFGIQIPKMLAKSEYFTAV